MGQVSLLAVKNYLPSVSSVVKRPTGSTARVSTLSMLCLAASFGQASIIPILRTQKPTLYLVGYSHLDTEWCWNYPQVIREFIPNTLHENFAMFEKYPDYTFNWTGSNRYKFMKEYYPADYATLKKYVAAGRWFPAGSSVEEGDVNSPSSESLIRQVMYGNQFFRREFNKASEEYMLPDCFGFPATLPSILAHCGIKGFSTQKLTWGSAVGIPFNVGKWIGPDDKFVVGAVNAGDYNGHVPLNLTTNSNWVSRLTQDPIQMDYNYFGVGDRGGSPREEDIQHLEADIKAAGPIKIVGGDADAMFKAIDSEDLTKLPTYKGDLELTQHSAGSLTSEAEMKRWNHENELLADSAEKASVAADWLNAKPYDHNKISDAWLRFLPGQFHDLMAGTALPQSYTYAWNDQVIAMNEFADEIQSATTATASKLDTRVKGIPLVVYNPLSTNRQDPVEANVSFAGGAPDSVDVYDASGKLVPSQVLSKSGSKVKVLILASVPSVGYTTFDIRRGTGAMAGAPIAVSTAGIENDRYKVAVDANGDVSSIYDKKVGKELLSAPSRTVYQHENPENWPSWNMDWSDQEKPPAAVVDGPAEIKVIEQGPVRSAIQITRHSLGSKFVQVVRLAGGTAQDRVEFFDTIDWKGKESALKREFPLTASNPTATYNWGIGTVQRGNNDPKKYEVGSHDWFDLTDTSKSYGVSVLDQAKFGSDKPNDNLLRLTLLYTPGIHGGYEHQATQDWGKHEILYGLSGHEGDWSNSTPWQAARLNQPLVAFQTSSHAGAAGKEISIAKVDSDAVNIMALKQAEDSDELIVRVNELKGKVLDSALVGFASPVVSARQVDGQERPIKDAATIVNGKLQIALGAYGTKAYAIRLAKSTEPKSLTQAEPLPLPYNTNVLSPRTGAMGSFDDRGDAIPAEMLPAHILSGNIPFTLSKKSLNAVSAKGQTIALPAGTHRVLYLLAASAAGDKSATFQVGAQSVSLPIQSWNGLVGSWDTRQWFGDIPELTYSWNNPLIGLTPGKIKRSPIAWCSDHTRKSDGSDDIYAFCYLFRYELAIPDGIKAIKLPNDSSIRVFAATSASKVAPTALATTPLYDTLDHSKFVGPGISSTDASKNDVVQLTIDHALYWNPQSKLHYTLDGSTPTASSPVYDGKTIPLYRETTVKAIQIDGDGKATDVTTATVSANDMTAPSVVDSFATTKEGEVRISLSEVVSKSTAETTSNYKLADGSSPTTATLLSEGTSVLLEFGKPVAPDAQLTISGISDLAPQPNVTSTTVKIRALKAVYELKGVHTFDGTANSRIRERGAHVPTRADAPWTINMFVYMDEAQKDLTILGGFGDGQEHTGSERFIIVNSGSVYFWGSNIDISGDKPYDLKKWQMVTATYADGTIHLYKNGVELASQAVTLDTAANAANFGILGPWSNRNFFKGKLANVTIWDQALPVEQIKQLQTQSPK